MIDIKVKTAQEIADIVNNHEYIIVAKRKS
jgi:hypothetical protein